MKKYKCYINNLRCANCANKIEKAIEKNNDISMVNVNFSKSTLTYEAQNDMKNEINKIIKNIEPDVFISTDEVEKEMKEFRLSILLVAVFFGLIANFFDGNFKLFLFSLAYILLLYKIAFRAIKKLIKSKTLDENALITISALGAYFLGQELEGIMVVALYTIGKILENKALDNSRKSIKNLVNIKEPMANILVGNEIIKSEVEKVKVGDRLVIKKGERIPVDGLIVKGVSKLDTSSLTGESEPLKVRVGSHVISGSINLGQVLEMNAESTYVDSTANKILELLETAGEKKAHTETIVQRMSKFYTPIVFFLAILVTIILPLVSDLTLESSFYRALTFLVIACPCAIVISVPLSYFSAIGVASRLGILVKGSNYLDNLSNVKKVVFDKTGTLTTGVTRVTGIKIYDESYKKDELIDLLVKGESFSNHPVANAFMKLSNGNINNLDVENFKEFGGKGISYGVRGKKIVVGSKRFCKCDIGEGLHMHIDGKHVASININDGVKKGADDVIKSLKKQGVETYMFTGDREKIALEVGNKLGIDHIEFEMLPTDKFKRFEQISTNFITVFVGDGVNDAPALRRADVGISMGGIGSDAAVLASDIVIMNDDLKKIITLFNISKFTRKIVLENLIFAISFKIIVLILSILGKTNMWVAVFADTGVTLITILNTLRIIRKFKHK